MVLNRAYSWPPNFYSFTVFWLSRHLYTGTCLHASDTQTTCYWVTAASTIFNFHLRFWSSSHIHILLAVGALIAWKWCVPSSKLMGGCSSAGRAGRLVIGRSLVQIPAPGRSELHVEVSLNEILNPTTYPGSTLPWDKETPCGVQGGSRVGPR